MNHLRTAPRHHAAHRHDPGAPAGGEVPAAEFRLAAPLPEPSTADPAAESTAPVARKGWAARAVTAAIRVYQLARTGHVSPCRFTPTCSQYAVEAVERHGARHGLALSVRRLGRCRPGGPSGYDPIPE